MSIDDIHKKIEENKTQWISVLKEVVAIQSVSATKELRPEVVRMSQWILDNIRKSAPGKCEMWTEEIGDQTLPDGSKVKLPPLVMGYVGNDASKKTVLIYAHYDVQPAAKSDGWDTEPFEMELASDGRMCGRGSTDDKGPLVGWVNVLRVYKELKRELPINIKFIFEGMEESGSVGFDENVLRLSKTTDFFKNIDFCCVSDNYWFSTTKPCLSYGLRGLTSCEVEITGPSVDLHSGSFGGMVYQPMDDLLYILGKLKDNDDQILIPGVSDQVMAVTPEERKLYENIDVSLDSRAADIGVEKFRHHEDKVQVLMNIWRNPSLTVHGIEGAFSEPGFKTVIPRRVVGKFSIRVVPNQTGEQVQKCIKTYLEKLFAERKSVNKMKLFMESGPWFYVDPSNSKVFKAADKAIQEVWKIAPDYTREGGSIPITLTLSNVTNSDLCLLPMGRSDDGAHAQNEKLDVDNYVQGMKVFASFLQYLAE